MIRLIFGCKREQCRGSFLIPNLSHLEDTTSPCGSKRAFVPVPSFRRLKFAFRGPILQINFRVKFVQFSPISGHFGRELLDQKVSVKVCSSKLWQIGTFVLFEARQEIRLKV